MTGRVFNDFPDLLTVIGFAVTEGFEEVTLVNCVCNSTGNLQSFAFEEFFGPVQGLLIHNKKITVCFQIDLIYHHL